MAAITHVTLNTGHSRRSPRSEVGQAAIDAVAPIIDVGSGDVPGFPGFRCAVTRVSRDAVFSLFRDNLPHAPFPVARAPLVSCGLGVDQPEQVWAELLALAKRLELPPLQARRPRNLPWLGVLLLPGLDMLRQQDAGWLGDFERVMAWALLERRVH